MRSGERRGDALLDRCDRGSGQHRGVRRERVEIGAGARLDEDLGEIDRDRPVRQIDEHRAGGVLERLGEQLGDDGVADRVDTGDLDRSTCRLEGGDEGHVRNRVDRVHERRDETRECSTGTGEVAHGGHRALDGRAQCGRETRDQVAVQIEVQARDAVLRGGHARGRLGSRCEGSDADRRLVEHRIGETGDVQLVEEVCQLEGSRVHASVDGPGVDRTTGGDGARRCDRLRLSRRGAEALRASQIAELQQSGRRAVGQQRHVERADVDAERLEQIQIETAELRPRRGGVAGDRVTERGDVESAEQISGQLDDLPLRYRRIVRIRVVERVRRCRHQRTREDHRSDGDAGDASPDRSASPQSLPLDDSHSPLP